MTTPTARSGTDSGEILFIGTATTLITYGGFTVLTDPNFLHRGQRAWLGKGLWSKRRTEPAVSVQELPPLDLVVLSHLHGDHFDRVARRGLDHSLPLVTTRHAARRLRVQGFDNAVALSTWQPHPMTKDGVTLTVTSMPGRHAPGPAQGLLPPVMGSLLEWSRGGSVDFRLYVSGDTLYDAQLLGDIPRRYPGIDLGVLHLGGTKILGLTVTMDGRQGVALLELVRPRQAVPVHYDDYRVFRSPLSDFRAEVERRRPPVEVTYLERGQSHRFTSDPRL